MNCPLCGPLAAAEGPLVRHMLRRHPEARLVASAALVGAPLLIRDGQRRLMFYLAVLVLAAIWCGPAV